jgi:hypothetical protein
MRSDTKGLTARRLYPHCDCTADRPTRRRRSLPRCVLYELRAHACLPSTALWGRTAYRQYVRRLRRYGLLLYVPISPTAPTVPTVPAVVASAACSRAQPRRRRRVAPSACERRRRARRPHRLQTTAPRGTALARAVRHWPAQCGTGHRLQTTAPRGALAKP